MRHVVLSVKHFVMSVKHCVMSVRHVVMSVQIAYIIESKIIKESI